LCDMKTMPPPYWRIAPGSASKRVTVKLVGRPVHNEDVGIVPRAHAPSNHHLDLQSVTHLLVSTEVSVFAVP
jgi:hypothetical protein